MLTQQHAPTRQAVLVTYYEEMRARTGIAKEDWAERVDRVYCDMVPEKQRTLPAPDLARVSDGDSWRKLRRAWDQQVRRYIDGSVKFPVELEEAWIVALDDVYRQSCLSELAGRMGSYHVPQREVGPVGDHQTLSHYLRESSDVVESMGRMLDDGQLGPEDAVEADRFMREADELIAAVEGMKQRVVQRVRVGRSFLQSVSNG